MESLEKTRTAVYIILNNLRDEIQKLRFRMVQEEMIDAMSNKIFEANEQFTEDHPLRFATVELGEQNLRHNQEKLALLIGHTERIEKWLNDNG